MPKTKISEFSATPANNTDIDSINISEGCAPSGINDAIRELMAQLKDFQTGAVGDSFNGPVGTSTAAAGAFTTLSSTGNTTLGDASGDSVTINGTATFANANPTLSAGTANGVAYLNGSKVVTSGSALTFDGTSVTASQFLSNGFTLADNTDITKKALFDLSGITTATTRTYTLPDVTGTVALLSGTQTFTSATTFSTTTGTLNLGTSLTTGVLTIGGTASTGNLVLGRSTATQTTSIQAGATASGSTKTINFGTGGLSGSTTAITIGSSVSGATSTITTNGTRIWSIEGSEQMRLTSTGLGIGTSSPAQTLHVKTSTAATPITLGVLSNSTTLPALSFNGAYASTTMAGTYSLSGSLYTTVPSGAAQYFSIADSIKATLDSSGNLGLGVTPSAWGSPVKAVQIGNSSLAGTTTQMLLSQNYVYDGGGDKYIANGLASQYYQVSGTHQWRIAPSGTAGNAITFTQAMSLLADGKLCLGATSGGSAGADFTLADTNSLKISFNGGAANFYGISKLAGGGSLGDGEFKFTSGNTSAGAFTFSSGGSERARIDSSGNLLVGTTTANFNFSSGWNILINSGASYTNTAHANGTASGAGYANFIYNSGIIGSITQSGTTAVLYNVTSDQRLKENIVDAPEFGSVIDSIKVRSFDWKTDQTHQRAGFVAQELVTVAPEAVHQPADPDEMMAVDYSKLVPMLVKEVQSLRKRLADAGI